MPLSYIRVVCRDCECVIADGWPPDGTADPGVPLKISRQICRGCEEEARLVADEDRRRGARA